MKKNFIFFISLVVVLQVNAQTPEQRMDELVSAYVNNQKFNGSVLVAQKGKVLYQKGWGFRNAEEKIPNDVNSIFQIGSVTKQFTAAIIMQLQQEHKLSVQDPLSKYFTGFVNGDKITIEHLLTHTSGIYNYTNDSVIMNNDVSKSYSQQQFIEIIRKYSPEFAPGTKWNYSNSGYQLLGYIIEKVEMKPYEQVVRQRIFQPLGMNNSGFDFEGLQVAQKTKGYFSLNKIMPAPVVDSTIAYAAGAIYSTVGDLYKWERAIFSDKILHPGSWNTVF
ncbi:MAG TPA: serine hydrolase domain-containing protein, partial [Flavisolibacter sp.]|nr:serine hydrolase domain-containing protein [Flavisolibacter sp.]